jgi:hypothetical protein
MKMRNLLVLCVLFIASPVALSSQTAQPYSVQVSALHNWMGPDHMGVGFEVQGRWNPGLLSIGGGIQRTTHLDFGDATTLTGFFIEPRRVFLAGDRTAPYASARFAVTQWREESGTPLSSRDGYDESFTGVTVNAGGGLLFRVTSRSNLDLGITVGASYVDEDLWPGAVSRIGFAVGVGR